MREILFRGKHRDKGFVFGYYGVFKGSPQIYVPFTAEEEKRNQGHIFSAIGGLWYEVYAETVGQFTGLADKNGREIFEGDIVKFTDSPFGYSEVGSVCFHEGSFCIQYTYWSEVRFHRIGKTEKWQDMGASGTVTYEYELLGNIHDNPELLEADNG